jgi:chromosome partitioning protein
VSGIGRRANAGRPPIVVVLSAKGGVGKTMIVMALLAYAAYLGRRVVGVDADPQASTYDLSSALHKPGYEVVHVRELADLAGLRKLAGYDLVVVDMPGNLDTREGKQLAEAVLREADFVVIPYDHQPSTLMPTMRTLEFVRAHKAAYRVLLTNIDGRLGEAAIDEAWEVLGAAPHFRTWLRKWSAWPNSQVAGRTIMRYSGGHAREARKDIAAVFNELTLDLGELRVANGRR